MSIYDIEKIGDKLAANTYPGRGIIIGKSADGKKAVFAYFIMGRSENSRNRIFVENGDEVIIHPFDASKVEDPSLIIYSPIRKIENKLIVTNGDQTDTVYDFIKDGKSFEEALLTREFEPDFPNFTPRISGMMTFADGKFHFKLPRKIPIDYNIRVGKPVSPENRYNFSFSGIKTALLYHVRNSGPEALNDPRWMADTAAGYQDAVVDVLVKKTLLAVKDFPVRTVVVAGGVACNAELRRQMAERLPKRITLKLAPPKYCTDNAAMVGGIAYHAFRNGDFSGLGIDSFARLPRIVSVPFAEKHN